LTPSNAKSSFFWKATVLISSPTSEYIVNRVIIIWNGMLNKI
jgi:hypothetical protein